MPCSAPVPGQVTQHKSVVDAAAKKSAVRREVMMMTTGKSIKAGSWFEATFLPQHINANLRDGSV